LRLRHDAMDLPRHLPPVDKAGKGTPEEPAGPVTSLLVGGPPR